MTRTATRVASVCFAIAAAVAVGTVVSGGPGRAAPATIVNGTQFRDTAGGVVHAHGGGVLKVDEFYYWFGEERNPDNTFRYVSAYRSTDLVTWEFRHHVLTQQSHPELAVANIERPKVIYNESTGQFVMWMHKENGRDYGEARAAVAVSSTIDGDYAWRGSFRPFNQHMSRDITLFRDDDGTGYMISAANENADLHVYRLTPDYLNVATLVHRLWPGSWREAPAMFKRDGVYFLLTSGATGWDPNQQKYSTASAVAGQWSALRDVGNGTAFGSQTAYVLPVQGTETTSYLYLGDRWAGAWDRPVNESQYVWLPLEFPDRTSMTMSWTPRVSIDAETGVVAADYGPLENLVARHSGKCLDTKIDPTLDNARATQNACGTATSQQFAVQDSGGGYSQIVARYSGKCLDVANESTADGAEVIQYDCTGGTNQQWQLRDLGDGHVQVVARHSGKCLQVEGAATADGVPVLQRTCGGGQHEQWLRLPV